MNPVLSSLLESDEPFRVVLRPSDISLYGYRSEEKDVTPVSAVVRFYVEVQYSRWGISSLQFTIKDVIVTYAEQDLESMDIEDEKELKFDADSIKVKRADRADGHDSTNNSIDFGSFSVQSLAVDMDHLKAVTGKQFCTVVVG